MSPFAFTSTRYTCPLPKCDWSFQQPPIEAPSAALMSALGSTTLPDTDKRIAETEAALEAHIDSHTPREWFTAMITLQRQLDRIRRDAPLTAHVTYECALCEGPAHTYGDGFHDVEHTSDCPLA